MSEGTAEIYYLSELELSILLAGKGVKEFQALCMGEKEWRQEDVCLAMHHLYQTNLIDSEGQMFRIHPALEPLILAIADGKKVFTTKNMYCFSIKEGYVFLRVSTTDPNSYEIGCMGEQEIKEYMDAWTETKADKEDEK